MMSLNNQPNQCVVSWTIDKIVVTDSSIWEAKLSIDIALSVWQVRIKAVLYGKELRTVVQKKDKR